MFYAAILSSSDSYSKRLFLKDFYMKLKNSHKLNWLLMVGLVLCFSGFLLTLLLFNTASFTELGLLPIIFLFSSIMLLYVGLRSTKSTWALYSGLVLSFTSIILILININFIKSTFAQIWPVIVIFSGISLYFVCIVRYKKNLPVFYIPSIVLFIMGCFFLLFSMHIIKTPFSIFARRCWPLLFIVLGLSLIIYYLRTSVNNTSKNKGSKDE